MKKIVVSFFILSTLMFSNAVFAADIDLFLSEQETTILTGTSKNVELIVRNNQGFRDTFSIIIFPPSINKVTNFPSPERVTADGGGNATANLSFTSFLDAVESEIFFNITVRSINTPSVINSRLIQVSVKRTVPVFISAASVEDVDVKPGETKIISITVTNGGGLTSDKYNLETTITKGGTIVKTFAQEVPSMPPAFAIQFNMSYTFDKYQSPGDYVIVSSLKDAAGRQVSTSEDVKKLSMKLGEVATTAITNKSTQLGFLNIEITVRVKNEGNVPANNFFITETIPIAFASLFSTEMTPDSTTRQGTSNVYNWFVLSLGPGEEFVVVYQFTLWKVWTAVILIGGALVVAFKFVFTVAVVKKVGSVGALRKGKEIIVHLEIKNRSINEVKDVVVRDGVPSFGEVSEKFHTIKPTVKRTTSGTALIWKFDTLRAGEERVLSYIFKPRIDVLGSAKLPLASVMFNTKRHQTKTSYSNRAFVGSSKQ